MDVLIDKFNRLSSKQQAKVQSSGKFPIYVDYILKPMTPPLVLVSSIMTMDDSCVDRLS